jgi:hypothetical protein
MKKNQHKYAGEVEGSVSDVRVPYWHRAHRDWRFIGVVVLMLLAVAIYLVTDNFRWSPSGRSMSLLDATAK